MAQSVHAVHQPSTIADSWKSPFRNAGGCWLQGRLTGRGVRRIPGYLATLRDGEYLLAADGSDGDAPIGLPLLEVLG
jgi:hypothetical protein